MEVNNNTRVTYAMTTEDAGGRKEMQEYIQDMEKVAERVKAGEEPNKVIEEKLEKLKGLQQEEKSEREVVKFVVYMDGNSWCASTWETYQLDLNLQEAPHGFGDTKLDAIADLIKEIKKEKSDGTRSA